MQDIEDEENDNEENHDEENNSEENHDEEIESEEEEYCHFTPAQLSLPGSDDEDDFSINTMMEDTEEVAVEFQDAEQNISGEMPYSPLLNTHQPWTYSNEGAHHEEAKLPDDTCEMVPDYHTTERKSRMRLSTKSEVMDST